MPLACNIQILESCIHLRDCPLLSTDQAASLRWRGDLSDVDWHLCRANTDTKPVDDSTHDQHGNVLCRADDNTAYHPDNSADLDSALAAETVRDDTTDQTGKPRATSHGGGDASLHICSGSGTSQVVVGWSIGTLVEVAEVRLGGDDGAHGTDVETEEHASNDGDCGDEVHIWQKWSAASVAAQACLMAVKLTAVLLHDGQWLTSGDVA